MAAAVLGAQASAPAQKKITKPAPPPALMTESAEMACPAFLGVGVTSKRRFCDVTAGNDPAAGILIKIPPHQGTATLFFDLHNRQTYSEEQVRAGRAFARYTATVGVFSLDNTLITRAAIESEFRNARDLVDRVGGGAGPAGVKAVAPTGTEAITVEIPADTSTASILGERLVVVRREGSETFTAPGRPIAIISNPVVEYRPIPPKKPAPPKPIKKAKKK